ncbi:MAG: EpsG family protein [Eubacterium sp.]|nr:EpsG family protein [Eubacterium sp.]
MNIFQINVLLIFLYAIFFKFVWISEKSEIWLNRIIASQLFFILGFRYQFVGTDTSNYFETYNNIVNFGFGDIVHNSYQDKGYVFIQWVISRFQVDFQFFLTILAFFNIVILAFVIEKYSQNVFLSWILFLSLDFYGFYFNGIRQALAMTLLFLSFHFLYEKKIKTSLLIYFFAVTIHFTAIIFGIIFILYKIQINFNNIFVLLLSLITMYFFRIDIAEIFVNSFKEGRYLDEISGSVGNVGTTFLIICICIFINLYTNPPWKGENQLNKLYTCILVVAAIVQSLSAISYIFTRLNHYFFVFIIICFPYILSNINGRKLKFPESQWKILYKLLSLLLIIICVVYYIPKIEPENSNNGILPYYFMWERS